MAVDMEKIGVTPILMLPAKNVAQSDRAGRGVRSRAAC
jgi:hypothetical protein